MLLKFIVLYGICVLFSEVARADIAIIVNPNNVSSWSDGDLQSYIKDIFLNKKEKFPDGTSAKPVDQAEGRSIRSDFYLKIASKDETAMNVYWSTLIFTGNGRPPRVVGDDGGVKRFVGENLNGIGYIKSDLVDNTIKVIYHIK